ncbi:helix-turn-helix domain-containing protein [Streptomyces sp. NBC_01615]|uniref:helix-turn-helix domain-containing protein n=1 Tax=Streptomyces sp. NBC_01615 TaxID=2975898 RepID=UPI0038648BD3
MLLDALLELFEIWWARGTPLNIASDGDVHPVPTPDGETSAPDSQLLSLLLSGLPDKAIASQLGVSLRTVQRRIRALMEATGSANRTQLGWHAAQQRWI